MDSLRHPSRAELADYAGKKLTAADLLAVDDHLARCAECRAIVTETLSAGSLRLDDSDTHLTYEEMEALVDGTTLADRDVHEQHLRDCPMCAAELDDLRALASRRAPIPIRPATPATRPRWWIPAGAAIAASIVVAIVFTPRAKVEAPTVALTTIRDGALNLALDSQGQITGASLNPADAGAIAAALRSGTIPAAPDISKWNRKPEALLGNAPAAEAAVIAPIAETVESDRPVFHWKPVARAVSYRVEVYDSSFNPAAGGEASGTEWRAEKPLARGQSYSWIVSAKVGANEVRFPQPPAPEAKFEVLNASAAAEMEHARQTSSLLLLAITAARHGLWTDANAALDELARLNPTDSQIRALRENVRNSSAPR